MRHLLVLIVVCLSLSSLSGQNALAQAEALAQQGAYQASSNLLEMYINEHPSRRYDLGRAWWLLSQNYLAGKDIDAARIANEKSVELRRASRSGDLAENYFRTAQIELAANQPKHAIVAAEEGLQMLVEDTELYVLLHLAAATAYAALSEYERVQAYLDTSSRILAIELPPSAKAAIEFYYTASELELLQGDTVAARQWYVEAVRYDNNLERLHTLFEKVY